MKRRALRSQKCKLGFHHGQVKKIAVDKDEETGNMIWTLIHGCRWHGCGCYCHPWFQKRTTIQARGSDGRRIKTTLG